MFWANLTANNIGINTKTCVACCVFSILFTCLSPSGSTATTILSPGTFLPKNAPPGFTNNEPITPVDLGATHDPEQIALGARLFSERRLSGNQQLACVDCHNFQRGGADGKSRSLTASGQLTRFNTPTIFNVTLNSYYYWGANFSSLDNQTEDAVKNLDTDWTSIMQRLNSIPEYRYRFNQLFSDGITKGNIKKCIIAFEYSLRTANSRFDRYLEGDASALDDTEKQGYQLFKSYGCITCHQGRNIGGNITLEIKDAPYLWQQLQHPKNGTGAESVQPNLKNIRVPSLRNVAVTGPYMHDGSVAELREVVAMMGRHYTQAKLPERDINLIVSYLQSLTGFYQGQPL